MDPSNDLLVEILRFVFALLTPLLVGAATLAVVQVARRFGLELSAGYQAKVEHYAKLAILEAEEFAAAELKKRAVLIPSDIKLDRAVATVLNWIPGVTRQEAIDVIHAALPQLALGASAGLGELRRAATNEVR